jgi:hypothetical protein
MSLKEQNDPLLEIVSDIGEVKRMESSLRKEFGYG